MDNKGPINKASVKGMAPGRETPILKEAGTSKTKKGKAKVNSKRTTLHIETFLWHKMKDVEKMVTSISNRQIKLVDRDRSVASPPIIQVSDNEKDKESRDIKECLGKIDSLFKNGIFADQENIVVEKEIDAVEEEVVVEQEVVIEEEKVAENEKEKEEGDFVEKVITAPRSLGANIDNLEQTGTTPVEVAKVTSDEQCNSWAIVVYTGPLQVASPTQTATDDAGAEPETGE
ncbi:hypothetical protein PVK06_012411 [Gossypium arboreum]|uniref:Uncharacterized protein n=1 Tax=Gossypium arboreum TaxID=29729 RepID=A0ABR0QC29_GOSAR|nr:hypothetical protein PVK06_012411 [Gossypium arboreum]